MQRIYLACLVLLLGSEALAQSNWTPIVHPYKQTATSQDAGCYFINESIGFIFSGILHERFQDNETAPRFYRTTNAGMSWEEIETEGTMLGAIHSLYFDSIHHGYAAVNGPEGVGDLDKPYWRYGGIFETNDTGRTWKKITPLDGSDYFGVISRDDYILATAPQHSESASLQTSRRQSSTDGGKTWISDDCRQAAGYLIVGKERELFTGFGWACPLQTAWAISYSSNNGSSWTNPEFAWPKFGAPLGVSFWGPSGYILASAKMHDGVTQKFQVNITKDKGETWETVREVIPSSPFFFTSVGAGGCAGYVQSWGQFYNGIIRSTDFGKTWKNIGGPDCENLWGLSVHGNGAVVYAMQHGTDTLWKTTTGGDGTLSSTPRPEEFSLRTEFFSSPKLGVQAPDTLHAQLCDSASLNLLFEHNGDCRSARLQSLRLDGIDAELYSTQTRIRDYNDGLTDSASAVIWPKVAGTFNVTLRATFEYSALERYDTLLPFVLIVHPNPSVLTVDAKPVFDLGFQRLCNAQTVLDSFSISAVGCDPFAIKSIRFEDDNSNSGYSFTSVRDLILTPDGSNRYFTISFFPNRAGTFTGRIIVEREDKIDTFFVTASAADDERQMVLKADTIVAQMCTTSEGIVELTNTSCRLITIDQMAVPAPLELLPNQLPVGVQPGKTTQLRLRFMPDGEGPQQVNALASMRFVGQSETIAFDTVLPLNVYAFPGTPLTATADTTIDLGDVSICSDRTVSIPIESFGCDTLSISHASLLLEDQGFMVTDAGASLIPVGTSTSISLLFAPPSIGQFTAELHIATNAGSRRVILTGRGVSGTRTLAASLGSVDFGETSICEERDSTVRFTNTGCDTLTITDAEIDRNFIVGGDFPIKLAPGESIELPITTVLDTIGNPKTLTGLLTVTSNADNTLAPITLSRRIFYPTKLRIESVDEASGKAGDEAKFRIILEGDVPSRMSALHFDFRHNNDLLSFESLDGAGLSITSTVGDADQRQSFSLSPVHAGVLGELTFKAYLAEAEQTTLTFDNIRFDAEGVSFAPECIAVISDSGTRFNYVYECGDNMIRSTLRGETLIKSLTPNPARNEIHLELAAGVDEASIVIVDLLGAEVMRTTSDGRIDVSRLSSGTYYLRVTALGTTQSRRVTVAH